MDSSDEPLLAKTSSLFFFFYFIFFFFRPRAIKAPSFLTRHMEQAVWNYCIIVSLFADCLYRHWRGMYEK